MKRIIWGITLSALAAGSANAALLGRVPATPGGTDYQAYYDTELNITWADAGNGSMTWDQAQTWIGTLNTASYLGATNWRLPEVYPVDGSSFDYTWHDDGSSDEGYNISALGSAFPGSTGSEMAHLYYNTLGNLGYHDTSGSLTGCINYLPRCLTETGPFVNLGPVVYWSDTTFTPHPDWAWNFDFSFGFQYHDDKNLSSYYSAWPVRDGDIGAVPVPGALWLFGTGLVAVAAKLRRRVGHEAE